MSLVDQSSTHQSLLLVTAAELEDRTFQCGFAEAEPVSPRLSPFFFGPGQHRSHRAASRMTRDRHVLHRRPQRENSFFLAVTAYIRYLSSPADAVFPPFRCRINAKKQPLLTAAFEPGQPNDFSTKQLNR